MEEITQKCTICNKLFSDKDITDGNYFNEKGLEKTPIPFVHKSCVQEKDIILKEIFNFKFEQLTFEEHIQMLCSINKLKFYLKVIQKRAFELLTENQLDSWKQAIVFVMLSQLKHTQEEVAYLLDKDQSTIARIYTHAKKNIEKTKI